MLILASASPRRRELLARMGLDVQVLPADIDEPDHDGTQSPEQYALGLAVQKAAAVFQSCHQRQEDGDDPFDPDLAVLGADTVVVDPETDEVFGKPSDEAEAKATLRLLSGRSHLVLTAVVLVRRRRADDPPFEAGAGAVGRTLGATEWTRVVFADLTDGEIDAYVATGEPMDKAGAYGIQGRGGNFVTRIEGSYDNVVGLPTHRVAELLGLRPPS